MDRRPFIRSDRAARAVPDDARGHFPRRVLGSGHTAVLAESPPRAQSGFLQAVGGRTVENGFHFSNALIRIGVSREVTLGPLTKTTALQLGLAVRSVHYDLAQQDHVEGVTRHLEESWLEWTPTWGLTFRFPELELRYRGRVSHGTDRLGWAPKQNGFHSQPPGDVAPGFFYPGGSSSTLDRV